MESSPRDIFPKNQINSFREQLVSWTKYHPGLTSLYVWEGWRSVTANPPDTPLLWYSPHGEPSENVRKTIHHKVIALVLSLMPSKETLTLIRETNAHIETIREASLASPHPRLHLPLEYRTHPGLTLSTEAIRYPDHLDTLEHLEGIIPGDPESDDGMDHRITTITDELGDEIITSRITTITSHDPQSGQRVATLLHVYLWISGDESRDREVLEATIQTLEHLTVQNEEELDTILAQLEP